MLHPMPADELGHIQKEISALRAREVALRKCFTDDCDDALYEGCEYDVEVKFQKRRVLAKDRLPAAIVNDPQYYDVKYAPVVRVVQRDEPRLPMGFADAGLVASHNSFEVVEAWN